MSLVCRLQVSLPFCLCLVIYVRMITKRQLQSDTNCIDVFSYIFIVNFCIYLLCFIVVPQEPVVLIISDIIDYIYHSNLVLIFVYFLKLLLYEFFIVYLHTYIWYFIQIVFGEPMCVLKVLFLRCFFDWVEIRSRISESSERVVGLGPEKENCYSHDSLELSHPCNYTGAFVRRGSV